MTQRQATIWRHKILAKENFKTPDRVEIEICQDGIDGWALDLFDSLSGDHYLLWSADQARDWLNDKY